ncbi:MAG: pro-sigmaK processing inhibitor BofA [Clostridia bacterium]|mgnify:CR=1 FL=1|nr:pro-sigmaK processing inhibitor BofA [Clostridia bacterium]
MNVELGQILFGVAFILFLLLIVGRILVKPLRMLIKLIFNSMLGLFMLLGFNIIGGYFGMTIPINLITVLLTGLLGLPGLILLIALKILGI